MGKRLLEQKARIDTERRYTPREALELLKELDGAKFDESVEAHVHLNVDPRRADQMVRGTLMLPNGTGKSRRRAGFAAGGKGRVAPGGGAGGSGSRGLAAPNCGQGFVVFHGGGPTPEQQTAGRPPRQNLGC